MTYLACSKILFDTVESGVIEIDGSHIKSIQKIPLHLLKNKIQELKTKGFHVEEFPHHLISPALVNPHTHLAMSFFRNLLEHVQSLPENMISDFFFKVEAQLTKDDVRAFTRMGAYESLMCGVGLVWDHYYFGFDVALGLQDVGLSGVVAPTLQDLDGPFAKSWEMFLDETLQIKQSSSLKNSGIFAALGPHATDSVSRELFAKILAASNSHKLPVHMHTAQTRDEWVKVVGRYGVSPVKFLAQIGFLECTENLLLVHGIYVDKSELQILKKSCNVTICFCPFSQMIYELPAHTPSWDEAGVPWVVGTDCVASNDSMNLQKELRLLAGFSNLAPTFSPDHHGFLNSTRKEPVKVQHTQQQPFRTWFDKVTRIPGSLHPEFLAGQIKDGALANICVWNLEHPSFWPGLMPDRSLVFSDTTQALHNMMVAGRWLDQHGEFPRGILRSSLYQEHRKEADERFQNILQRFKNA